MKRISTKITVSMIAVAFAVLSFVGVMLIINMTLDYHRDFDRAVTAVFENNSFATAKENGIDAIEQYILSEWDGLCRDSDKEYYILSNGNIVKSSKRGGIVEMTSNLKEVLSGGVSRTPDITSDALDYAINTGNGVVVYILDTKTDLYASLKNIAFLFIQALFIGILIAALLSFIISKRLTASLGRLEEGAKRMSKGDFTAITVKSRDEVANLCDVFNEMGKQIQNDFNEFERVEKSRREFVANVSHELKTPLTVIKSYSETLCSTKVDADTEHQFLSVINSEVDRMTDIVGQLLKVSRLNEQIGVYNTVSLDGICRDIIDTLAIESGKKHITVTLDGKAEVTADADNTATIITNLLTNAIKYSEENGTVTVTIQDGDHPTVTVTDNGIGISEKDLPHIFERFYRTDKARGRKTGGTGLGLAIALECAKSMGADIKAESIQGEYTKFTLEF